MNIEQIKPDRDPDLELVGYLHRWCLVPRNRECNIYLHHIIGPDEPVYHDHPWDFTSLILSGGYTEHLNDGVAAPRTQVFGPGDVLQRYAKHRHYLDEIYHDTWTLVITGPVIRQWGFWPRPDVFVPSRIYHGRRIEAIKRNGYEVED